MAPISPGWFLAALIVWGVGVQSSEALASIGLAACFVLFALDLFRKTGAAKPIGEKGRWVPLALFLSWALLAPLLAGRLPTGSGIARLADWAALPAAAWGLSRLEARQRRVWLTVCSAVFLVSCVLAGFQSYGVWPSAETLAPLQHWGMSIQRVYEEAPNGRYMGGGLLFHRLKFAHVGGLVVLAAFGEAWAAQGQERVWALGIAAIGAGAVAAFPFARSALVALAASLALMGMLAARRLGWALLAGGAPLCVLSAALVLSPTLRERFGDAVKKDSEDRAQLWGTARNAILLHPWVGLGAGRFHPADFAPPGITVHEAASTVKAHNQLLTLAAEGGLIGATLFVVMLLGLAWEFERRSGAGLAGLGALCFFALVSLLHDPLFHAHFSMALVLLLGHAMGPGSRAATRS